MIYWIVIFILLLLSYVYDYSDRGGYKYKNLWYYLILILFIFLAGFRYRLGVDTIRYMEFFTVAPTLTQLLSGNYSLAPEIERFGLGFLFFWGICKSIYNDYFFAQIVHAILVNSIFFYFIKNNTRHIFFGILLYFLISFSNLNCEIIREALSICTFLIAWKYFIKRKWIKYYICAFIAILFHISGAILLIFPIFRLGIFKPIFKLGFPFFITCIVFFLITTIISKLFFSYLQLIDIAIIEDYGNMYENSSYGEGSSLNLIGYISLFLNFLFYPIASLWIYKKTKIYRTADSNYNSSLEYFICWYTYIVIAKIGIMIFYRFYGYIYPFVIICIADGIYSIINYKKKILKFSFGIWLLFIAPFLTLKILHYFSSDYGYKYPAIYRYYPYNTFFTPENKDEKHEEHIRYFTS